MSRSTMRRLRLGFVALLPLAAMALVGCGGSGSAATEAPPKVGGTLHISQGEEVVTLDPMQTIDSSSINVVSQIDEPLFRVNESGKIERWLVTDVKKSDGEKVWTLTLRQGVKFSDGAPMTSADVLFTLEQARKSTYWEALLAGVEKVEAPSPSTIVIKNKQAAPELEVMLSQWSFGIVPKDWGGEPEKAFAQHPIGTGPFVLGPWKHGESVTLERNPGYWGQGRPYLDKVVFQTVDSPESRVSQLKGGQLDVIYAPPYSQLKGIEATPGLRVGDFPLGYVELLIANGRIPLFQNQKAREAVLFAIDREGLVSAALSGEGQTAGNWIPPAVPYSDQSIKPIEQDVPHAKELLAEAVAEGVDPTLTLLSNAESPYWATGSQVVQQNLEEAGFHVKIDNGDVASQNGLMEEGKFDLATSEFYSSSPSPAELVSFYVASEGLSSGADVDKVNRLYERAIGEMDPQKRQALWNQVQQTMAENQLVMPLTYSHFSWALKDDVSGFTIGVTGIPWLADTAVTG